MSNGKQRHGCVTAWLILIIVLNGISAATIPKMLPMMKEYVPNMPDWILLPLIACALLNVVFAVALFKWKKWGFYGFVLTAVAAVGINVAAGLGMGQVIFGFIPIVVLYAVLQIGGAQSAWSQLE